MEKVKVVIPVNKIPSVNHVYGNRAFGKRVIRYETKAGKDFKKIIREAWLNQTDSNFEDNLVEINIKLYFGDKRKHDWDNYSKSLCDSLNDIAYNDDSQIMKGVIEKFYDKENPRIELELKKYEN